GTFACASVGLGALAAHRQAAQVANPSIALDTLEPLQIHSDLAAQVPLDDVLAVLNRVDDLRELLLGQVFGADAGVNFGLGQDDFRVAGTKAVNVAQSDFDAFVGRNFYSDNSCHNQGWSGGVMEWWSGDFQHSNTSLLKRSVFIFSNSGRKDGALPNSTTPKLHDSNPPFHFLSLASVCAGRWCRSPG